MSIEFSAPDHEVILPCGILSKDGKSLDRRATIRRITAGLRAELGKKELRSDGWKQVKAVLGACVASLGDVRNPPITMIDAALISADREYLAYEIKRISVDSFVKARLLCQKCAEIREVSIDVSTFPVYGFPDPADLDPATMPMRILPPIGSSSNSSWGYYAESEDGSISALIRHDTGADRDPFIDTLLDNESMGIAKIVCACLVSLKINGSEIKGPISYDTYAGLPSSVAIFLEDAWTNNQGGIDTRTTIICEKCKTSCPWTLSAPDFFTQRSGPKKETRKIGLLRNESGK